MKQQEKTSIAKARIIDAAAQLFSSKGYDETSMDDIIALSETSKGAIYHHFASKQSIMEMMIERAMQHVNQYAYELAENKVLNTHQKISMLIGYFVDNQTQEQLIKNNWIEKVPFALLRTTRNTLQNLVGCVEKIIRQGIEKGEYTCKYPKEIAATLLLLFDIWLDPVITEISTEEISSRLNFVTEFLRRFGLPILGESEIMQLKKACGTYSKGEFENE